MARRASTATTATPAAPSTPPTSPPIALAVLDAPSLWMSTSAYPISAPQAPLTRIATKATTRAPTEGRAVSISGLAGSIASSIVGRRCRGHDGRVADDERREGLGR